MNTFFFLHMIDAVFTERLILPPRLVFLFADFVLESSLENDLFHGAQGSESLNDFSLSVLNGHSPLNLQGAPPPGRRVFWAVSVHSS